MAEAARKERPEGEHYERAVELVNREVLCCASYFISELAQNDEACKWTDEISEISSCPDYEEPARYHIQNEMSEEELREYLYEKNVKFPKDTKKDGLVKLALGIIEEGEAQDFCETHKIDPEDREAYEHWIVSKWFGNRLKEAGEMVIFDFMGFPAIWGRTCSGQAIALDGVIQGIAGTLNR